MAKLTVDEVLYDFEQPMLFTATLDKEKYLATLIDDDNNIQTYMAAVIEEEVVNAMAEGRLSIYGAFNSAENIHVIRTDFEWNVINIEDRSVMEMGKHMAKPGYGLHHDIGTVPDILLPKP